MAGIRSGHQRLERDSLWWPVPSEIVRLRRDGPAEFQLRVHRHEPGYPGDPEHAETIWLNHGRRRILPGYVDGHRCGADSSARCGPLGTSEHGNEPGTE